MYNNNEELSVYIGDKEISAVYCGDKEIWTRVIPDIIAFSANITAVVSGTYCYGFKETSKTIDNELLSQVTAPITNYTAGTSNPKVATKTARAYTPTTLALQKYKYAIVTVLNTCRTDVGSQYATIGGKSLPNRAADDGCNTTTLKFALNSTIDIVSHVDNQSSYSGYLSVANVAISKIVLTNS